MGECARPKGLALRPFRSYVLRLSFCKGENAMRSRDCFISTVRRWLRSCAICGHFVPPIDTYCRVCWKALGRRQNRGVELYQGHRPFPVYSLYLWSEAAAPWVSAAIFGFKGGREARAAEILAGRFSFERSSLGLCRPCAFIVPPRSGKRRDHAWLFARSLAEQWGAPLFDIFEQSQKTNRKSQKSQDLAERAECRFQLRVDRQTVQDLLAPSPGPIVFVDDVITSGATAMAAYMALEDPSRFEVWTLANRPKLARQTGI